MSRLQSLALATLPLLLAACAATPTPPATASGKAAAPADSAAEGDTTPATGSRFVKRGQNDRNVRSIGNDAARGEMSEVKGIGNAVGARGN